MPDQPIEVQAGLSLDLQGFKKDLSEAETLMQQGVERMNALGMGQQQQPTVVSSPAGAPPPLPPPAPIKPESGSESGSPDPILAAWTEFEKIRGYSKDAPDVAMAALGGQGGLKSRVAKGAAADPESAESYQQLLNAIKELTKSIQAESKRSEDDGGGGGIGGMFRLMKQNALFGAAQNVAGQAMSGNVLGAGGGAIGGLIGLIGGPGGAMLGSQIGSGVGSAVGGFISGADEARQYSMLRADMAARFGDFGQEAGLSVKSIKNMDTSGYSIQDTAQLFDSLRGARLISDTGEESKELVENIQVLTRALGTNTDALVSQYGSYKTGGGREDITSYMGQVVAGAVSVGMRQNLQEYSEMLGSARMQLVYRGGQGDIGDGALKSIQGTLTNLMGNQSRTAELLRDNPMMAQQVLSGFLSTGGAQAYSFDAAAMQMAGIDRSKTDAAFLTPEQQVTNAAQRMQSVIGNVVSGGATDILGMSREQLQEAVKNDPNFIQSVTSSSNPNTQQAGALQDLIRVQFKAQYGRMPTAQDMQVFNQLATNSIGNGGQIDLSAPTGEGGKSIGELIAESQKTEGQAARDAADARHKEMMALMQKFEKALNTIDKTTAQILSGVNTFVNIVKPIADKVGQMMGGTVGQTITGLTEGTATEKAATAVGASSTIASIAFGNPAFGVTGKVAENVLAGIGDPRKAKAGLEDKVDAVLKSVFDGDESVEFNPIHPLKPDKSNIHAKVNDTPPEGFVARPGFDTFQFAHGDLIHATQSRGGESGGESVMINVNLSVPNGADFEWTRAAAQSGAQAGLDEFYSQRNRVGDRNRPRINNSMY